MPCARAHSDQLASIFGNALAFLGSSFARLHGNTRVRIICALLKATTLGGTDHSPYHRVITSRGRGPFATLRAHLTSWSKRKSGC